MPLPESGERYLETILKLSGKSACVRSVAVAEEMGYSKSSVSRAVGRLRSGGYLIMEPDGRLVLTEMGAACAENASGRRRVLAEALVQLGVSRDTAERDAFRIERCISDETFRAVRAFLCRSVREGG